MRRHSRLPARLALLACLALLAPPAVALARPGGGQSFSGSRSSGSSSRSSGSSSRSSGSSGGRVGGDSNGGIGGASSLSPAGIVVLLLVLGVIMLVKTSGSSPQKGWTAGSGQPSPPWRPPPRPRRRSPRAQLRGLEAHDPAFSVIVFEDFLAALYTDVVLAVGRGGLGGLEAYVMEEAARALSERGLAGTTTVLIGALQIDRVDSLEDPAARSVSVAVVFETNLSRRDATGAEEALYSRERWVLRRAKNAKSRAPDKARVFTCPSCSAPLDAILAGRCKYCSQEVATGAFDWVLRRVEVLATERRGPMLTGNSPEEGNDRPTVVDPEAVMRLDALRARDPSFAWEAFTARVQHIFHTFQRAWSGRELSGMRPFLSDALFSTQTYWVSEYLRQHLRNVTENARILHVELARVTSDAYFDAITLRVYATSLDYTVADATGAVVAGNRQTERRYSEYWTLIRSAQAKGAPRTDPHCPRCGAPLAITMAGDCTHCQAKVTAGQFDWVLSRIEQDEVYDG
ncbi:MAG TPA: Tim44-like domain-containing protein [Polyangiaceae bacterium]|nr:Tim44-like domain-containing protein [Polyangiaceae bacterium]